MIRNARQKRWSLRRNVSKAACRSRAIRCEQLEDRRVLALSGIPTAASPCTDFFIDFGLVDVDIPDPGWTWVNPDFPIREVAGLVTNSKVTHTDFPTVHDSHDQNTDILVDPEYLNDPVAGDLISIANGLSEDGGPYDPDLVPQEPNTIEVEWETGIAPSEHSGDGTAGLDGGPMFPKWAWPSPGDRVWFAGHHIYDCGHPLEFTDDTERTHSEIHPAIAVASMRNQVDTLPATGTTPVPIVATDLYIHGDGGFATDVMFCGGAIIVNDLPCNTHSTPIARNFEFDIKLPPKPADAAVLSKSIEDGPGNTISISAELTEHLEDPMHPFVHVLIPLAGSGVDDLDVYARQIKIGWAYPTEAPVKHLSLTLNKMNLRDDMDTDAPLIGDHEGELSFFWLNVDRASNEWERLSDFDIPTDDDSGLLCESHTNTMTDYDDEQLCGNGELNFTGPHIRFLRCQRHRRQYSSARVRSGLPGRLLWRPQLHGSHISRLLRRRAF